MARTGLFLERWHVGSTIEYHQSPLLCTAALRYVRPSHNVESPSETGVPTCHVPKGSRECGKARPSSRPSFQFRQRSVGYWFNVEQRQDFCKSRRRKLCVGNRRAEPFTKQPIAMLQQPALSQRLRLSVHGSSLFDPMEAGNWHPPCTAQPGVAT